jgi:hypothetical protein
MKQKLSNPNFLEEFKIYLTDHKKLSQKTVDKHVDNLDFYINIYLNNYNETSVLDSTGIDIEDFLGSFLIRKLISSTKSDVYSFIRSFKKFYRFLLDTRKITKDQYEDVYEAFKNPYRYLKRFDSYFNIEFDSPDSEKNFEKWLFWEDEIESENDFNHNNIPIPDYFQSITQNLRLNQTAMNFLQDFNMFLLYCVENHNMKLTKAYAFLLRKHIHKINEKLLHPEELKPTINQPDAKIIHLFYILSLSAGLLEISSQYRLVSSRLMPEYQNLSQSKKFFLLIDTLWNQAEWKILLKPYSGGRPEWSQNSRKTIEKAISEAIPNHQYQYEDYLKKSGYIMKLKNAHNYQNKDLTLGMFMETQLTEEFGNSFSSFIYNWGVVPERILPALQQMGLIQFGYMYEDDSDSGLKELAVEWIVIAPLGKQIFSAIFLR